MSPQKLERRAWMPCLRGQKTLEPVSENHLFFSDLQKIILQQRMDFVTSEAWMQPLRAFDEGQKIPGTSLKKI